MSSSSSYVTLPPVWEKWEIEDVRPLDVEELGRLHMIMWRKLEFLEDEIEHKALLPYRKKPAS